MSLELIIADDIKKAMLAKDQRTLQALRAVKSALLLEKTAKNRDQEGVSEQAEMQMLQKLVKQRLESAQIYTDKGREELAEEELFQADVIKKYLPEPLDEQALRVEIAKIITSLGASSVKDMGKVMGFSSKQFAGRADNKMISDIVKELLT